jgi:hypothetical protein
MTRQLRYVSAHPCQITHVTHVSHPVCAHMPHMPHFRTYHMPHMSHMSGHVLSKYKQPGFLSLAVQEGRWPAHLQVLARFVGCGTDESRLLTRTTAFPSTALECMAVPAAPAAVRETPGRSCSKGSKGCDNARQGQLVNPPLGQLVYSPSGQVVNTLGSDHVGPEVVLVAAV